MKKTNGCEERVTGRICLRWAQRRHLWGGEICRMKKGQIMKGLVNLISELWVLWGFFWIFFFFYTAGSYWLSILYLLVYICQSQPPNSSDHPLPLSPVCPYVCSLPLCLFLPWRLVHLYHFSRFHVYALIYDLCFSLSDILHSVWQSLGPSMSLQMTQFHSFLWLSNTHCIYVAHLLYPLVCRWAFRLLPHRDYCK